LVVELLAGLLVGERSPAFDMLLSVPASAPAHGSLAVVDIVRTLLGGGLGTAGLFVVAGELTLGGTPEQLRNPACSRQSLVVGALSGLAAGVGLALLTCFLSRKLALLFDATFEFLGGSAEVSLLGWQRLSLGVHLALGGLGACCGGLLVALSPTPAPRRRRVLALAIAALPAVALLVAGTWFERLCMGPGEMRLGSLAQAAGLEPVPSARVLILPAGKQLHAISYPMEVVASGMLKEETIGATRKNLARVRDYIASRGGRWTAYSLRAWGAQAAIADRLLEPQQAVRLQLAATEATKSALWPQLLVVRLARMPPSPAASEVGEQLLDPRRFIAGGERLARLSAVAQNIGRIDQAQALWAQALADGFRPGAETTAPQPPPRQREPADGAISGEVRIDGRPASRLRVALYHHGGTATPLSVDRVPFTIGLLAAADTDQHGRFAFSGLRPRAYFLALLLPEEFGGAPALVGAAGNLGPFDLAKGSRTAHAGVIDILSRAPGGR
jgi:hypothetical protein